MPSKFHIAPDTERSKRIRASIAAAGGLAKMAAILGYRTAERVRQFYAFGYPVPAEKAREFCRQSSGIMTLRELRPDLYADLTAEELGYTPTHREV